MVAASRAPDPDDDDLTLDEVAAALSLHYMTVYKYVRTGRLPAHRLAGRWRVAASDVAAMRADQRDFGQAVPGSEPGPGRRNWTEELLSTLVEGTESAAWEICTAALASSHTPESLYLEVLAPAMRRVGDSWSDGSLTVAQEHRASVLIARLIGRLGPMFVQRGRPSGHVILGSPSGDTHALASALLADLLRGRGLDVVDLGADTPVESFLEALAMAEVGLQPGVGRGAATDPHVKPAKAVSIGVVISSPMPLPVLLDLMARVRASARGTVVLGGRQVAGLSAAERSDLGQIGVTLSASYAQALDLLSPGSSASIRVS